MNTHLPCMYANGWIGRAFSETQMRGENAAREESENSYSIRLFRFHCAQPHISTKWMQRAHKHEPSAAILHYIRDISVWIEVSNSPYSFVLLLLLLLFAVCAYFALCSLLWHVLPFIICSCSPSPHSLKISSSHKSHSSVWSIMKFSDFIFILVHWILLQVAKRLAHSCATH